MHCLPCVVLALGAFDASAESKNGFDLDDALVPVEEIVAGGPPRDGIPALDYPAFVAAAEADFLKPADRVLGIAVDGTARAYPVRILNHHEVINDAFAGTALAVTYCPLCNSGIAFNARAGGRRLEFGVSGLLYNSDVLLYDRATGSLWSQIEKSAISGKMRGTRLEAVPLAHTTWRDWVARYPDTDVLSDDTGFPRDYRKDPYRDYRRARSLMFPVAAESSEFHPKSLVLGLEIDGHFKAYPFSELQKGPHRFSDAVHGRPVEIRFDRKNDTAGVFDEGGREISSLIAYWFAWYAFHPDTEIYRAE